ncbi:unnamed protein product (mitochondrion) [Plasmodiophora brassicae]|uniref:Putative restriction endonuclease domain-containing protein n=1 Tax=Plasmodiophora brassicae TaxID=37360 RepID=A0A3P3YKH9_PLABS|nr:unnamed protein product [Plasmodiophora brassicae]
MFASQECGQRAPDLEALSTLFPDKLLEWSGTSGLVGQWRTSNPGLGGLEGNDRGGFLLPNGDMLIPDASYVDEATLTSLSADQRRMAYLPCVPTVVIKLVSETDDLEAAIAKMQTFASQGCKECLLVDTRNNFTMLFKPHLTRRPRRQALGTVAFEFWPRFVLDSLNSVTVISEYGRCSLALIPCRYLLRQY